MPLADMDRVLRARHAETPLWRGIDGAVEHLVWSERQGIAHHETCAALGFAPGHRTYQDALAALISVWLAERLARDTARAA